MSQVKAGKQLDLQGLHRGKLGLGEAADIADGELGVRARLRVERVKRGLALLH